MFKKLTTGLILTIASFTALAETIWLDVRSSSEFSSGHIEGAIHLTHTNVTEQASSLLPNKDDEILVYCRSGGRSGKAETMLKELGYTNVKNIGGLADAKKLKAMQD
ncbi:MAG: phage shock protein E [Crocinitomicaceae bacterium]|jgi:phage shock protein E